MKIVAHLFSGDDTNSGRQQRVQTALEFERRERRLRLEVRHLTERVYAGIGAARAVDDEFFLRNFACRLVDCTLDRGQSGLILPAVKVRAIVGNCESDISHETERLSHARKKCGLGQKPVPGFHSPAFLSLARDMPSDRVGPQLNPSEAAASS